MDNLENAIQLEGGLTNKLYLIDDENKRLVRIFGDGTDLLVDRKIESIIMERLSKEGIGPRILEYFDGGRVEEYLDGRCLTPKDLHNKQILTRIAKALKNLHMVNINGIPKVPKPIILLKKWTSLLERMDCRHIILCQKLHTILELIGDHHQITLCHNDLTPSNIMLDNNGVKFIDFEYSGYNYTIYDIANFFCEMQMDYDGNRLVELEIDNIDELKQLFCDYYCNNKKEAERMVKEMVLFEMVSHYLWGIWALLQDKFNHGAFDYQKYAQYRLRKFETLFELCIL